MLYHVEDGKLVDVKGDPKPPDDQGRSVRQAEELP